MSKIFHSCQTELGDVYNSPIGDHGAKESRSQWAGVCSVQTPRLNQQSVSIGESDNEGSVFSLEIWTLFDQKEQMFMSLTSV